ncbi:MAG: hypothetical protein J5757_09500 [Lachnospiraceae bacterium]|nr:hypothetical protein [Lachnospiraceae bacterium]
MTRKISIITIMAFALACFIGCSNGQDTSVSNNTNKKGKDEATTKSTEPTLPEYPYSVIISDDRVVKDPELPEAGNYVKQLKILYGEIPADAPYLTKEKAIEICQGLNDLPDNMEEFEWEVTKAFNAYAMAPDFEGGSGIMHRIYYTDESRNTYIDVMYGAVYYRNRITKEMELILDTDGTTNQ